MKRIETLPVISNLARACRLIALLLGGPAALHAGFPDGSNGDHDGGGDAAAAHGMSACHGHVDIDLYWDGGRWVIGLKTDAAIHSVDDLFLYLSDKPHVAGNPTVSGARRVQPASASFNFTGVAAGQPIWMADQGTPGIRDVFPGFNSDQGEAYLANHLPADSRLLQARPWIRASLVDYVAPHGRNAHFSMWNSTTGKPPTVWMSTLTDVPDDSYYFAGGTHAHLFWGFGSQGIHKVRLRASSLQTDGTPTGFSEPFTITFAVGTVAYWQASWFDTQELEDPDQSSLAADPDGDGLNNLIEYAFGTNPRRAGAIPHADGLGLPRMIVEKIDGGHFQTLIHPRRRAGLRYIPETYQALFADSPDGPWSDAAVVTEVRDFPPSQASLNDDWELVLHRHPVSSGGTRGFGRVRVIAGDGF